MSDDIYFDEQVPDDVYGVIEDEPIESELVEEEPQIDGPVVVEDEPAQEDAHDELPEPALASFYRRLNTVRCKLKAPKNQWNGYGEYYYRSCEDILEGVKPLLDEYDLMLTITDDVVVIDNRFYLKATATVHDVNSLLFLETTAFAREPESRKGSDQSQVTGSCSSYARKYALNALFLIDDTKDADVPPKQEPKQPPASGQFVAHCRSCGKQYTFVSADQYNQFITNPGCCPNPQWEVL